MMAIKATYFVQSPSSYEDQQDIDFLTLIYVSSYELLNSEKQNGESLDSFTSLEVWYYEHYFFVELNLAEINSFK